MKKSVLYVILGLIFLSVSIFAGVNIFWSTYTPGIVTSELFSPSGSGDSGDPAENTSPTLEKNTPSQTAGPVKTDVFSEEDPEGAYVSPVDFAALQQTNPDIYAWLEIEDTDISYPIVQSATDDTFYLNHNSDGAFSSNGAIFSESAYNGTDMSDPVTVLYGHHMVTGAMFGNLQAYYSDIDFFSEDHVIRVYTPSEVLQYHVFAAVPYPSTHILYSNDFTVEREFNGFFESVMSTRDLSARFNEAYFPTAGDRVLVLSTCLIGNNSRRFVVMATLVS